MESIQAGISARVKAQYEAYPYPNYNLCLPLRTQEAYASHSLFAARLLEQLGIGPAVRRDPSPRILLAGCGDIFPYMATFWEPRPHRLMAVDLSARNLARARLRCLPRLRRIEWRQGNLEDPDFALPGGFSHIDSYGVLHHLAHPAGALRRFGSLLLPGGTARIMVYNVEARHWIRHVRGAFALLGLSPFRSGDLRSARGLLDRLAGVSPALRERFAPMRGGAFANRSRFVDTFFHAREARLDLDDWLRAIGDAGLRVVGVFDRNGELDDLANPLLEVPEARAWRERIADRRFENDFELYLAKPGPERNAEARTEKRGLPSPRFLNAPPRTWFAYAETHSIPWILRRRIWSRFLRGLRGPGTVPADSWAGRLPTGALQRLGRLGALFPDDFRSPELRDLLRRPLHASMEPPECAAPGPVRDNPGIRADARRILEANDLPAERLGAVMDRLEAAQRP